MSMLTSRAALTRQSSLRGSTNSRAKGKGPPHDDRKGRHYYTRMTGMRRSIVVTTLAVVMDSCGRHGPLRSLCLYTSAHGDQPPHFGPDQVDQQHHQDCT